MSIQNNNNQQKITTTEVILAEENVEDKHGLFNSPANVKEEYTYKK